MAVSSGASDLAIDYIEIKNTIARYCFALDSKDFDLLDKVFTSDVDAKFPFSSGFKGLENVKAAIEKRYPISMLFNHF